MHQNVAITGYGIVSAIGVGADANFASLCSCQTGIDAVRYVKTSLTDYLYAEVKLSNKQLAQASNLIYQNEYSRTFLLGLLAAREAVNMAQCEKYLPTMGLFCSTTSAGVDIFEAYVDAMRKSKNFDTSAINSFDCGDLASRIASFLGIRKNIVTNSTACSSSANAIMNACRMIRSGNIDRILVGGADSLNLFNINGFNSLEIISKNGCRPFCEHRNGMTPGEGAAFLVLEAEEKVGSRPIYGYVSGYSNYSKPQKMTEQTADGAIMSMTQAISKAGLAPSNVDFVYTHGTGTVNNDMSECQAIKDVFGNSIPPFSSIKEYVGHTFAASGALGTVVSLMSINKGVLFPNAKLEAPMSQFSFSPIRQIVYSSPQHILVNSFGFGGSNTSLIISKN